MTMRGLLMFCDDGSVRSRAPRRTGCCSGCGCFSVPRSPVRPSSASSSSSTAVPALMRMRWTIPAQQVKAARQSSVPTPTTAGGAGVWLRASSSSFSRAFSKPSTRMATTASQGCPVNACSRLRSTSRHRFAAFLRRYNAALHSLRFKKKKLPTMRMMQKNTPAPQPNAWMCLQERRGRYYVGQPGAHTLHQLTHT